jgi:hypothetical protein
MFKRGSTYCVFTPLQKMLMQNFVCYELLNHWCPEDGIKPFVNFFAIDIGNLGESMV